MNIGGCLTALLIIVVWILVSWFTGLLANWFRAERKKEDDL